MTALRLGYEERLDRVGGNDNDGHRDVVVVDDDEDDDDDFKPIMLTVAKKSLTIFIKSCRQKYIWKNI